jgi:hypothetical protein
MEDVFFSAIVPLFFLAAAAIGTVLAIDAIQLRRSYDARVVCEQQLQRPLRKALTTQVTCVPRYERQDTLTLQGVK